MVRTLYVVDNVDPDCPSREFIVTPHDGVAVVSSDGLEHGAVGCDGGFSAIDAERVARQYWQDAGI